MFSLAAAPAVVSPAADPASGLVEIERARYLMGTICSGRVHHPDRAVGGHALEAALDEIAAAEAVLSTWREDTELARLNARAGGEAVEVSAELARFLEDSLELARQTGGAFDPAVGALVTAWDLRGEGRRPGPGELRRARARAGHGLVRVRRSGDRTQVRFRRRGVWIDPGGIGKGWALDRATETLRRRGIRSALLDCGGQIVALGAPPGEKAWRVAVADPRRRRREALVLELRDASVATSGLSERSVADASGSIGHVLDPRSGRPLMTDGSVSVVAPSATAADALATALLVMGPDEGTRWLERHGGASAGWLLPEGEGLRLRAAGGFRETLEARRPDVRISRREKLDERKGEMRR